MTHPQTPITLKPIITTIALGMALTAGAQTINLTEDVELLIEPEVKEATRLSQMPSVLNEPVEVKTLTLSEYTRHSQPSRSQAFSEPVEWGDTLAVTPWRGYAAVGYLPLLNAGLTAGYRIIDNDRTLLNAWLQYGGYSLKRTGLDNVKHTWRQHSLSINAALQQNVADVGTLSAALEGNYSTSGMPMLLNDPLIGLFRMNLDLGWASTLRKFDYYAAFKFGVASFSKDATPMPSLTADEDALRALRELRYDLKLGVSTPVNRVSSLALDVEADFLRYNHRAYLENNQLFAGKGKTLGDISLRPALRAASPNFNANIGIRADITVHSGKTFHIAPDVMMEWSPISMIALYGRAGGGEHLNSISSLYEDADHYMLPNMAYGTSHLPFTLEAGVTLGRWKGLSLEVSGFFGRANDWLMPAGIVAESGKNVLNVPLYQSVNLRGWQYSATLRYRYKNLGEAYVGYAQAPQTYEHGYYLWRDRARRVVSARVHFSPIEPLDVNIDYEYRAKRATYLLGAPEPVRASLGDASLLNISATYRITEQFSAFINLNNLLNSDHYLLYGARSRGIYGLAGVAYKF